MPRYVENPVLKETIRFTRTAEETGGKVSDLEITLMPGGGNPLHYHKGYSETFTALVGDLGLGLGGNKTVLLRPGKSHVVESGQVHRFFNPTDGKITFRNEVRPGHTGLENGLKILAGLANDGLYDEKKEIPRSLIHLAVVGIMSEMRLPGLMSLTTPVMQLIAARSRRNGTERALLERYCQPL